MGHQCTQAVYVCVCGTPVYAICVCVWVGGWEALREGVCVCVGGWEALRDGVCVAKLIDSGKEKY